MVMRYSGIKIPVDLVEELRADMNEVELRQAFYGSEPAVSVASLDLRHTDVGLTINLSMAVEQSIPPQVF